MTDEQKTLAGIQEMIRDLPPDRSKAAQDLANEIRSKVRADYSIGVLALALVWSELQVASQEP